jgi:hypothetical protein
VQQRQRRVPKRAFNWTSREHFPFASTVGGDLGKRLLAQRFPGFADTEGVTGSNPVAPTIDALTSGNAGQSAVRGRFGGPCPGWRAFPVLTFLFKHPLGPDPLSRSFERPL